MFRKMCEHGLDRGLGQPLGYQIVELDERTHPVPQRARPAEYFRDSLDIDHRHFLFGSFYHLFWLK